MRQASVAAAVVVEPMSQHRNAGTLFPACRNTNVAWIPSTYEKLLRVRTYGKGPVLGQSFFTAVQNKWAASGDFRVAIKL